MYFRILLLLLPLNIYALPLLLKVVKYNQSNAPVLTTTNTYYNDSTLFTQMIEECSFTNCADEKNVAIDTFNSKGKATARFEFKMQKTTILPDKYFTMQYDNLGRNLSGTGKQWDKSSGIWTNLNRYLIVYDTNQYPVSCTIEKYLNGNWSLTPTINIGNYILLRSFWYLNEYSNNLKLLTNRYSKALDLNVWTDFLYLNKYLYDGKNNLISDSSFFKPQIDSSWQFDKLSLYSYNTNNDTLTKQINYYSISTGIVSSANIDTFYYSKCDTLTRWVQYSIGSITSKTKDDIYEYNDSCKLIKYTTGGQGNQNGPYQYTYSYNNSGQPMIRLSKTWVKDAGEYANSSKDSLTFNNYGQILQVFSYSWNGATGVWTLFGKTNYTYSNSTTNTISFISPKATVKQAIKLDNLKGSYMVYTLKGEKTRYSNMHNYNKLCSKLPPGVYLFKNTNNSSFKFITYERK